MVELLGADATFHSPVTDYTATLDGRRAEGALLVVAGADGSVCELTLMVRPLGSLLAGVERMKALLAAGRGGVREPRRRR